MKFKIDKEANVAGTGHHGYFKASYKDLVNKFGEPFGGDDDKISTEWVFTDEDNNVFTIYDYAQTNMYAPGYPSVKAFRAKPMNDWHVGSKNNTDDFETWLYKELE